MNLDNAALFKKIGMNDTNIGRILKNKEKCEILRMVILEAIEMGFVLPEKLPDDDSADMRRLNLLQEIAVFKKVEKMKQRKDLIKLVVEKKISNKVNLNEGLSFLFERIEKDIKDVDMKSLCEICGVGVEVTEKELKETVATYLKNVFENDGSLDKKNIGNYVKGIKDNHQRLKFADGKALFGEIDKKIKDYDGKKCEPKKKEEKKEKQEEVKETDEERERREILENRKKTVTELLKFHVREMDIAKNSKEMQEKHLKVSGGKPITRFPPEPNGYLHIGHAKSMLFNFGLAHENGGKCYLRYDDTNPEKETQEFIDAILEMVKWMGHSPDYITFASDYFNEMYEAAEKLCLKGLAFVDFSTKQEIKKQRNEKLDSPYRDKFTPEENLKLLRDMRGGKYKEGECCLRCKIDNKSPNPNMRDFIAYRIKYVPHPHVGDKWCIYPTYDFSHNIEDSIENITHSMCTLEFENRRESYYWELDVLDMYKPFVWEFSRLNITTSLLSKRKINALVAKNVVTGFDDPRLLTLAGLRRRGYTPEIINTFVRGMGASRSTNTLVSIARLEETARDVLDTRVERRFCVMDPLKIILTNFKGKKTIKCKNHPNNESLGTRDLEISNEIFIEKNDFREVDRKDFFGLAPNKTVGLKFGPNIICKEIIYNEDKTIKELKCEVDWEKKEKPKCHIHWVSDDAVSCEVRLFDHLLAREVLDENADVFSQINKNSKKVMPLGLAEKTFALKENRAHLKSFQFERLGYFTVDLDTNENKLVFNSIIGQKQSKEKANFSDFNF